MMILWSLVEKVAYDILKVNFHKIYKLGNKHWQLLVEWGYINIELQCEYDSFEIFGVVNWW